MRNAAALGMAAALALAGCRKTVPDEAWARALFATRQAEIDDAAAAIEAAARDFLPVHPPKESHSDPALGLSFYDARRKRCDSVRQRMHDEIAKHPRFVEVRINMRTREKNGLELDPCSSLGTPWAPLEERFGDVAPENGVVIGGWSIGRKLTHNREERAIETMKHIVLDDLTLDLRFTIVDDTAKVER